jgi:hypothetical protein
MYGVPSTLFSALSSACGLLKRTHLRLDLVDSSAQKILRLSDSPSALLICAGAGSLWVLIG